MRTYSYTRTNICILEEYSKHIFAYQAYCNCCVDLCVILKSMKQNLLNLSMANSSQRRTLHNSFWKAALVQFTVCKIRLSSLVQEWICNHIAHKYPASSCGRCCGEGGEWYILYHLRSMPVTCTNGRPNSKHDMQHPPAPHSAHSANAIHVELIRRYTGTLFLRHSGRSQCSKCILSTECIMLHYTKQALSMCTFIYSFGYCNSSKWQTLLVLYTYMG